MRENLLKNLLIISALFMIFAFAAYGCTGGMCDYNIGEFTVSDCIGGQNCTIPTWVDGSYCYYHGKSLPLKGCDPTGNCYHACCGYDNRDPNKPSCPNKCEGNIWKYNGTPVCTGSGWRCHWDEETCTASGCCNATCTAATGCGLIPNNNNCPNYCVGSVRYYNGSCQSNCTCSYSSEDCNYDGCYYGYYRNYYCSGGSCTYTSSCIEACCDQYYGSSEAYCSGDTCYPPPTSTPTPTPTPTPTRTPTPTPTTK